MITIFSNFTKRIQAIINNVVLYKLFFYSSKVNVFSQEFVRSTHTFLEFLKNIHLVPNESQDKAIGIVISPWLSTAVPWYSLIIAIGLVKKGKKIILIWDDTYFPEPSFILCLQNFCIGYILNYLNDFFPVFKLSLEKRVSSQEDQEYLSRLANWNLIWYSRAKSIIEPDSKYLSSYQSKFSQVLPLVKSLLSRIDYEYLVVPGGIYGSSNLFVHMAQKKGIRVATYDGGEGCLFCCSEGIAAHQADIPVAFKLLWDSSEEIKQKAIALAQQEFKSRTEGKDYFGTQIISIDQQKTFVPTDILIPLNLEWDSAALGKHYLFNNTVEWLLETITFILANSDKSVVVRQHPAERLPFAQSLANIEGILKGHFGHSKQFYFITATQKINTYNLLESASLVIPFVSTIGLEAAAMGKNVLIAGDSYYRKLGFVWNAESRVEYFDILLKSLHDLLPPLTDSQEKAWLCYYLTQVCNLTFTRYNPELKDFWYWINQSPSELFSNPIIVDMLTAIDTNKPFAWLRHHHNFSQASKVSEMS